MSITYNLNIPDPNNNPSDDQPNIQTNTNSVNAWTAVDHFEFISSQAGHHQKSTYVEGSDPGSIAGQYVVYSKLSSSPSQGEMFVQKDGTSTPIQISRGVPVAANPGFTYLPGGLYMVFGNIGINPSGTLNFPAGVSMTNIFSFSATSDQAVALYVSGRSSTSITVSRVSGSGSVGAYIMVIGN